MGLRMISSIKAGLTPSGVCRVWLPPPRLRLLGLRVHQRPHGSRDGLLMNKILKVKENFYRGLLGGSGTTAQGGTDGDPESRRSG
jgi:hypothetical protein